MGKLVLARVAGLAILAYLPICYALGGWHGVLAGAILPVLLAVVMVAWKILLACAVLAMLFSLAGPVVALLALILLAIVLKGS